MPERNGHALGVGELLSQLVAGAKMLCRAVIVAQCLLDLPQLIEAIGHKPAILAFLRQGIDLLGEAVGLGVLAKRKRGAGQHVQGILQIVAMPVRGIAPARGLGETSCAGIITFDQADQAQRSLGVGCVSRQRDVVRRSIECSGALKKLLRPLELAEADIQPAQTHQQQDERVLPVRRWAAASNVRTACSNSAMPSR